MTVVVDLGCLDYDRAHNASLGALIDEYQPDRIYGFDPNPRLHGATGEIGSCRMKISNTAAWLYDGEIEYYENGTGSTIGVVPQDGSVLVSCFDFSAWLRDLNEQVVLKVDIEGAEYPLLKRLLADGTASQVDELIVEWHGDPKRRERILAEWPGPVKEWWL